MHLSKPQTWIIGNWKKNPATVTEVINLATDINNGVTHKKLQPYLDTNTANLMIVPSALHIVSATATVSDVDILVGCQDVSHKSATVGAYTGDCSAQQMKEVGVSWTLVGHSERREYHRENNDILLTKFKHAFEQGLGVVFCIGETLDDYENKKTIEVLHKQLAVIKDFINLQLVETNGDVNQLLHDLADNIIIAYEPVWAIGTGKVPTVAEVEMVNQNILDYLATIDSALASTPILYGGSVNPENAEQFAQSKWINGALIGGASLVADKFLSIAETFFTIKSKQS